MNGRFKGKYLSASLGGEFRAAARAEPRPTGRGRPRLGLPSRFWREQHVPYRPRYNTQFKDQRPILQIGQI